MKRYLLNIASGISLLLCGILITAWVQSRTQDISFELFILRHDISIHFIQGLLRIDDLQSISGRTHQPLWSAPIFWQSELKFMPAQLSSSQTEHHFLSFGFGNSAAQSLSGRQDFRLDRPEGWTIFPLKRVVHRLVIPIWFCIGLCTLFPLRSGLVYLKKRNRMAKHLCTNCGYDLRATPGRCPECGTLVKT